MKHIFFVLFTSIACSFQPCLSQDAKQIKGYINDDYGAVVGATIWLDGTTERTTKNAVGYYEIPLKKIISHPLL